MLLEHFTIRDNRIAPATVLAPMAGVTDTVFRRMIRGLGGCGLIMTEFTSAECITRNAARTSRYLFFEPDEHPITGTVVRLRSGRDGACRRHGGSNWASISWTSIWAALQRRWSSAAARACSAI